MAVIDRLPLEVLQDIFIYACKGPDQFLYGLELPDEESWDDWALPFQHSLLQVCRPWNVIASSSTQLWSSIAVYVEGCDFSPRQAANMHRFVHFALQRAGSALLDIDLNISYQPKFWTVLSPPLLPEAHRWRGLTLDLAAPLNPEDFATLRGRLPNLEWLKLKPRPVFLKDAPWLQDAVSQMVEDAPKLRKLECGSQHLGMKFRWDQIQELKLVLPMCKIQPSFWDDFRVAVSSTSLLKLTIMKLDSITEFEALNGACLPATSPSIQEFSQFLLAPWPTLLELPALRKTEILTDTHLPTFTNYIQQFNCRLITLEITIHFFPVEDSTKLTNLYAVLPHLTSLTIFLRPLEPTDNLTNPLLPIVSPNTLPSLAVLQVHWDEEDLGRPEPSLTLAPVFLPMFTSIIKAHRPSLESVGFRCITCQPTQVDWTKLETLDAFVDLGSCDEIFRMNCWATPIAREYEYLLVRASL